jgi:hypothetical protein
VLVHGWDLSRALRISTEFPDGLAARELDFTGSMFADIPPKRSPFGPPQPVAEDAPEIDRLAALFGQDPAMFPLSSRRGL